MKMTTASLALTAFLLGMASAASSADKTLIYKSIDADGTTVFTDQPAPEATIITPPPLNIADQPPATSSTSKAPTPSESSAPTIDSVTIISPAHEQTFIDPQSALSVEFSVSPADTLPVGLTAQVLLDGTVRTSGSNHRLPIDIPERGTHTVQIQIVDSRGDVLAESELIDIHVRYHATGGAN